MNVVVCDDDVTLRGVVSKLASDAGLTVLAETDSATDAVDLIARFGADLLVLDLALPWGSGIQAVHELRERGADCQIVVFTSFSSEEPAVRDAKVRAIVEKPDFEQLSAVLAEVQRGDGGPVPLGGERRQTLPDRPTFPRPASISPSGLEDVVSFAAAVEALEPGDAVLVVHVGGIDAPPDRYGRLLVADRLLTVARSLRAVLRTQDRVSLGEDDAPELVALLLGAQRRGTQSVWDRLERIHKLNGDLGVLSGGWALVEPTEPPTTTPVRARDAAHRSIGRPAGDRLWAG